MSVADKLAETIDLCDSDTEGSSTINCSQDVIILDDSTSDGCSFINDGAKRLSLRDRSSKTSPNISPILKFEKIEDKEPEIQIVGVQLGRGQRRLKHSVLKRRSSGSIWGSPFFAIKPKLQSIQKKNSPRKKKNKRRRQGTGSPAKTPQKTTQYKVNQAKRILQNRQYTQDKLFRARQDEPVISIDRNPRGPPRSKRKKSPFFSKGPNMKFRFHPVLQSTPITTTTTTSPVLDDDNYCPWSISTEPDPSLINAPSNAKIFSSQNISGGSIVPLSDSDKSSSSSPSTTTTARIVTRTRDGGPDSFTITTVINNNNIINTSSSTSSSNQNTGIVLPPNVPSISQNNPQQQQVSTTTADSNWSAMGSNLYISKPVATNVKGSLRPIVIDGSNVAMGHGNNKQYSCRGIQICCEYFKGRGHETVYAFVPRFRLKHSMSKNPEILDKLDNLGICKFTPSREVDGVRISSYDDRYIVQLAAQIGAVIVSNDNFRDLYEEQPLWRETIRQRVLQYTWVNEDCLMFPPDPLGARGPTLAEFLRF